MEFLRQWKSRLLGFQEPSRTSLSVLGMPAVPSPRRLSSSERSISCVGDDVDDEALALDFAAHLQELRRHHRAAVLLEHLGPDHDVDDAGLVLERDEDHALGGAGALAHQHEARHADAPARQPLVPVLRRW